MTLIPKNIPDQAPLRIARYGVAQHDPENFLDLTITFEIQVTREDARRTVRKLAGENMDVLWSDEPKDQIDYIWRYGFWAQVMEVFLNERIGQLLKEKKVPHDCYEVVGPLAEIFRAEIQLLRDEIDELRSATGAETSILTPGFFNEEDTIEV